MVLVGFFVLFCMFSRIAVKKQVFLRKILLVVKMHKIIFAIYVNIVYNNKYRESLNHKGTERLIQ